MVQSHRPFRVPFCVQATCFMMGLLFLGCGGKSATPELPGNQPSAQAWLQQTAKVFSSVEPSAPDTDLPFLDDLIGNATIVGLGEATHGSSEFQKMKHRVFRYMVEHKGVTAFGLEAQMGRCRAIDQYVLTGQGDPVEAMRNQGFWVWSTQEMLDLVNWMRAYNSDPTHSQKLRFFGFDMQDGGDEMEQVLTYLRPIDPEAAISLAQLYAPYQPYTWGGVGTDYFSAPLSLRTQCRANIQQAYQWMLDHQETYAAATGIEAYAWTLQLAKVVVQNEALNGIYPDPNKWDDYNIRDQAMADNIDWYIRQFGPGAKIVLSAHNGHINKEGWSHPWINTGKWLFQRHGAAYLSVGFAFDSGDLLAVSPDSNGTYQLQSNTAQPCGPASYENTFVQANLNLAFLDMRNLDVTQSGPAWFSQQHTLREVGAVWNDMPGYGVRFTVLPRRFDALIFLKNVTATTRLPR